MTCRGNLGKEANASSISSKWTKPLTVGGEINFIIVGVAETLPTETDHGI